MAKTGKSQQKKESDIQGRISLKNNLEALNRTFDCIVEEVLPLDLGNLEKLILIQVILQGGVIEQTNGELADIFNRDAVTISKAISRLQEERLLSSTKQSSGRMLAIANSSNPFLYNYSYSNLSIYKENKSNNNITINNKPLAFPIRRSQVQGIARIIHNEYSDYNAREINIQFNKIPASDWQKKMQSSNFGKTVIDELKRLINTGLLTKKYYDPYRSEFENHLFNGLVKIFETKKLIGPQEVLHPQNLKQDEKDVWKEENERRIKKYTEKAFEEKLINVSSDAHLQEIPIGSFVKVNGYVNGLYVSTNAQPMCNYNLLLPKGDVIHAAILSKQFKGHEKEFKDYNKQDIQFIGLVVYNNYLKKRTIRSLERHHPVRTIEVPGILNTKLNWNTYESDQGEEFEEESPF